MSLSYFVYFEIDEHATIRIAPSCLARVVDIVATTPGMTEGLVFTPPEGKVDHPFPDDRRAPALALQLQFPTVEALEHALRRHSHLQRLAAPDALPSLAGTKVTQQAMVRRRFPVDDAAIAGAADTLPCSYLVHYPGAAEDLNLWMSHYVDHHPAIMRHFPGVRLIEIYSRLDWCGFLPWPRVDYMQRNKLMFDTPQALSDALLSPVIKDMRADFHSFPKFTGNNIHFPMLTRRVDPVAAR